MPTNYPTKDAEKQVMEQIEQMSLDQSERNSTTSNVAIEEQALHRPCNPAGSSSRVETSKALQTRDMAVMLLQQLVPETAETSGLCLSFRQFLKNANTSQPEDVSIDRVIPILEEGIQYIPSDNLMASILFNVLGACYQNRFQRVNALDDISRAIECHSIAAALVPDEDQTRPFLLSDQGYSHQQRHRLRIDPEDVNQAINCHTQAVSLLPEGHIGKFNLSKNLFTLHLERFDHLDEIDDIHHAIKYQNQVVSSIPDEQEDMFLLFSDLAHAYNQRFQRLGRIMDIHAAIDIYNQAVLLSPQDHEANPSIFSNLGVCHKNRFIRLGELADINMAIELQAKALLLSSQTSASFPEWLSRLAVAYHRRLERVGDISDADRSIEAHSKALSLTPEDDPMRPLRIINLGSAHCERFGRLGELVDIDTAIEFQSQALSLSPEGHSDMSRRLATLSASHQLRFDRLGERFDIDKAIELQTKAVLFIPRGHPDIPLILNNLGVCHNARFHRSKHDKDLEIAILTQTQAVSLIPDGHASKPFTFASLGRAHRARFDHLGNLEDINKSIECQTKAVLLTPEGHVSRPNLLSHLGMAHRTRFDTQGDSADLETALDFVNRALLLIPVGDAYRSTCLGNLGFIHQTRLERLADASAVDPAIDNFRLASRSPAGNPSVEFGAALQWAKIASRHRPSTSLEAYKQIMALVPRLVWLGGSVGRRYEDIVGIESTVVEAAAAAISFQAYDRALEWLEEGRSIVWKQTLQLRSPNEELLAAHPALAVEFVQVSRDLDQAGRRDPTTNRSSNDTSSMKQAAHQYRRLAERWEQLVSEVRTLPGFEYFLRPKKASDLMCSAKSGPVVVINVHETRCDALILKPGSNAIHHVPLVGLTRQKASQARAQLLRSLQRQGLVNRGFKMGYQKAEDNFEIMLGLLWTDVVKPVLDFLEFREIRSIEGLPHITWCPTGPLAFLPLHAAGNYRDPSTILHNLAISSYTPTLSALLVSPRPFGFTGLLAVGQTSTSGLSDLPGTAIELTKIEEQIGGHHFTRLESDKATPAAVLAQMSEHSWVHLACHATQNSASPTESAFYLHNGMLGLASITRKELKHAEFAFLSACQTATGDESLSEEAVHLAAGMIMAGYPSVIATMWSIHDDDAPLLAEKVYAHLLEGGTPDAGRAARALHIATQCVREKVGVKAYARWVPYIHIGL